MAHAVLLAGLACLSDATCAYTRHIHDTWLPLCRELQHFADRQEHVLIERASCSSYDQHDFLCTKELQADKLKRMQDATLLLATLQRMFSQVRIQTGPVTNTFLHCTPFLLL